MEDIQALEQQMSEIVEALAAANADIAESASQIEQNKAVIEQAQAAVTQLEAEVEAKRQASAELSLIHI